MIRLSASSIKDFLKCSKMFYYRKNFPEEAVSTREANIGIIVHELVQTHWKEETYSADFRRLTIEYGLDREGCDKVDNCMQHFYSQTGFRDLMTDDDKIEYEFELPISKDVKISGRIDRVIPSQNVLIDWKTGTTKRDISNDIQFMLYYAAYNKLFNVTPSVWQVNLANNETHLFQAKKIYFDALFDQIIPKVVESIKKNKYYKEGYFNGGCYRCSYISPCSRDL